MTKPSDDLLNKVTVLKKKISAKEEELQEVKSRTAVVKAKLTDLQDKLYAATGQRDWTKAREYLDKLQDAATAAFEALAEALDGVDIDFD